MSSIMKRRCIRGMSQRLEKTRQQDKRLSSLTRVPLKDPSQSRDAFARVDLTGRDLRSKMVGRRSFISRSGGRECSPVVSFARDTLEGRPARQGCLFYGQDKESTSHVERKRQIPMAESSEMLQVQVTWPDLVQTVIALGGNVNTAPPSPFSILATHRRWRRLDRYLSPRLG